MDNFSLSASDGASVACYRWLIDSPTGLIHIAHGMGEHAQRYDAVAQALNNAGFSVYANDHRGHGVTGQVKYGDMGGDGWNRVLADAYELNQHIRSETPGKSLILLGHSMGSMMAQQYITRYGASIDALVLSGSPGFKATFASILSRCIAAFERWRVGPTNVSAVMQKMLFGDANKAFDGPDATGFEWLSRDPAEVKKYMEDEACGFVLTTGSLLDLFTGSHQTQQPTSLEKIPKQLPMYIFSGEQDPVHTEQKDINRMLQAFYSVGLKKIEVKWYPNGRHEMFNEINRDQVLTDLVAWLKRLPSS